MGKRKRRGHRRPKEPPRPNKQRATALSVGCVGVAVVLAALLLLPRLLGQ
ncbi:MAG: hypothetical protein ACOCUS_06910 [Polyangiales bacterium]